MMYIVDSHSISPQLIDDVFMDRMEEYEGNRYYAIEPSYKELIPRAMLRRMGKGIRIGIGCGLPLLKRNSSVDGIIIATTSNGLGDCINFLNQIKEYDEGSLTPTHFVQSTPNSLSGQLALLSNNPCYNSTHVQFGNAFENALIDASMLFSSDSIDTILVGDVEEISSYNYMLDQKRNKFKSDTLTNSKLIESNTKGTVSGEGSSMFVLSKRKEKAISFIKDVTTLFDQNNKSIKENCLSFIQKNGYDIDDFDAVVLGYNGNVEENNFYDEIADLFPNSTKIAFKQLIGEYSTSTSFALYFASQLIEREKIPSISILKGEQKEISRLLIYNSYQYDSHNFIILEKPS